MDTPSNRLKKEAGFVLLDLCMTIGIVLIVLGMAFSNVAFDRDKFLVDQTTRHFALAMREAQFMDLGRGRIVTRVCTSDEGDVFGLGGVYAFGYIERIDKNLRCRGYIEFKVDGRPKGGMNGDVYTRDDRYHKKIIISAQTGRIRIA